MCPQRQCGRRPTALGRGWPWAGPSRQSLGVGGRWAWPRWTDVGAEGRGLGVWVPTLALQPRALRPPPFLTAHCNAFEPTLGWSPGRACLPASGLGFMSSVLRCSLGFQGPTRSPGLLGMSTCRAWVSSDQPWLGLVGFAGRSAPVWVTCGPLSLRGHPWPALTSSSRVWPAELRPERRAAAAAGPAPSKCTGPPPGLLWHPGPHRTLCRPQPWPPRLPGTLSSDAPGGTVPCLGSLPSCLRTCDSCPEPVSSPKPWEVSPPHCVPSFFF